MYPSGRYDDLSILQQTIPSFWTDIYDGRELIVDLLRGEAVQERQVDQMADELNQSISRQECPSAHRWLWLPIILANEDGVDAGHTRSFPLAADILTCAMLADRFVEPSALLTGNVEFFVDAEAHQLIFAADPFLDDRFHPYEVDGQRFLRIYLFAVAADGRYLQKLWGSVTGILRPTSENYRRLTEALLNGVTGGGSIQDVLDAASAILDIPLAQGDETVETITADADGLLVLTDVNVYRFVATAEVQVEVGDSLRRGQSITTGLQWYTANRGVVPPGLTELTVDGDFLWPELRSPLTFANDDLPLTVVGTVAGFTKVTFPLDGDSGVVASFFTEMHARGVAAGKVLADYLDIRATPTTPPTAAFLPATVNPLQLLFANALRSNLLLLRCRPGQYGPNALDIDIKYAVRQVMAPHGGLIVLARTHSGRAAFEFSDSATSQADAASPGAGAVTMTAGGIGKSISIGSGAATATFSAIGSYIPSSGASSMSFLATAIGKGTGPGSGAATATFSGTGVPIIPPIAVTTINFIGFETGDLSECHNSFASSSGEISVQPTVTNGGAYALRSNAAIGNASYAQINPLGTDGDTYIGVEFVVDSYVRFYFRYAMAPSTGSEDIAAVTTGDGTIKLSLRLNNDGTIAAYHGTGGVTLLAVGTTVLAADTWYRIEYKAGTGTSADWEVRIDGATEIAGTDDLNITAARQLYFGKLGDRNSNAVDYFYDDIRWSDSGFPGAGQVVALVPTANSATNTGGTANGAGSKWQCVNEVPPDSDSTYVNGMSTSQVYTAICGGFPGGAIGSVKSVAIVKRDGGTNGSAKVAVYRGSLDTTAVAATIDAAYNALSKIYDEDPIAADIWTTSTLNNTEVGFREESGSSPTRATGLYLMVDYVP